MTGCGPRISVVTAVRNEEKYIRSAVASVLNQTFRDFEYIIVDDASTDSTPAILDDVRDGRVVRIRLDANRGSAEARNVALRRARGEYVAIQDGDDWSFPERLAREAAFLDANPEVAMVGSGIVIADENGCAIRTNGCDSVLRNVGLCHGSVMFRRACVEEVGLYRPGLLRSQDRDLMARIAQRYETAKLPDVLCQYRLVPRKRTVRAVVRQCRYDLLVDELNRNPALLENEAGFATWQEARLHPAPFTRGWWQGRRYVARWCREYGALFLAEGRYAFAARHYAAALLFDPPLLPRARRVLARVLLRGRGNVATRAS